MDFKLFQMFIQLIFALGITLALMFLTFKLMGSRFNVIANNKYIKVIEKVQITKDNAILIVKIGEKGYVMTSSSGHMEKLLELSEEEVSIIETSKKEDSKEMVKYYADLMKKTKESFSKIAKNIKSKEEKHDK